MNDPARAVLLINKPSGITSSDLVHVVKKELGVKKAGHAGTLDRFATGLMVVCTGSFTRLSRFFLDSDKEYSAEFQFGYTSDTGDPEGTTVQTGEPIPDSSESIIKAMEAFTGEIDQVPPVYSALKVSGKRASDRVRDGEHLEMKSRRVTIYDYSLRDYDQAQGKAQVTIRCSKGTYVRSLARDLGEKLGCGAYVTKLERSGSGNFSLGAACKPGELVDNDRCMVSPAAALAFMNTMVVSSSAVEGMQNGKRFSPDEIVLQEESGHQYWRILDEEGDLRAVAEITINPWSISYTSVFNS